MKKLALLFASLAVGCGSHASSVSGTSSNPEKVGDGCYAIGSAGVICITGTSNDESIRGENAMVAKGFNVAEAKWCGVTTSSGGYSNRYTLQFDPSSGMVSIEFDGNTRKVTIVDESRKLVLPFQRQNHLDGSRMFRSKVCKMAIDHHRGSVE